MQIEANVTGNPDWTIREDLDAAVGATRLAALGSGLVCRGDTAWLTLIERARPDRAAAERYDEMFAIYVDLYPALVTAMGGLAKVRQ